jgi:hypothetical protein
VRVLACKVRKKITPFGWDIPKYGWTYGLADHQWQAYRSAMTGNGLSYYSANQAAE